MLMEAQCNVHGGTSSWMRLMHVPCAVYLCRVSLLACAAHEFVPAPLRLASAASVLEMKVREPLQPPSLWNRRSSLPSNGLSLNRASRRARG